MLAFLGLKVMQPLTSIPKYNDALVQIKHYLSFKTAIQLQQTQHLLSFTKGECSLQLPKSPHYLHNCYYIIPILHPSDMDFLDISYEALMIIRQTFPSKIAIDVVTDSEAKELAGFEERKKEEFERRVNANLRALIDGRHQLTSDDVQDIIYLCANHYIRKNKVPALKLLISRINASNLAFPSEYVEALQRLKEDSQLKKLAIELITKIRTLQRENQLNKQNTPQNSNSGLSPFTPEMLKINCLRFQLKESYSLQRICLLLSSVLQKNNDREYMTKLEPAIVLVTNRFLEGEYQQSQAFGPELSSLLGVFWEVRNKKWDSAQKQAVMKKVNQLNSNSRMTINRSKTLLSRQL